MPRQTIELTVDEACELLKHVVSELYGTEVSSVSLLDEDNDEITVDDLHFTCETDKHLVIEDAKKAAKRTGDRKIDIEL